MDKFNVDDIINLAYQVVLGHEFIKGMVSNWYCCGPVVSSLAVSPFFALTLLDQSPGLKTKILSAI
ncbi:hypothetical protein D3C79_1088510 [compost metagenome]